MTVRSDITCLVALVLLRRQSRIRIPKVSMGMVGLGNRGIVIIMIALLVQRINAFDGRYIVDTILLT